MTPQQNRLSGKNNLTYLMMVIITLSLIGKLVGIGICLPIQLLNDKASYKPEIAGSIFCS